jgi:hypothetical protein
MTMQVTEALEILGAKRVIWIDDRFNIKPQQLAAMLTNGLEIALDCDFPELQAILEAYDTDPDRAVHDVTQKLTDLDAQRIEEIRTKFFAQERMRNAISTDELSGAEIALACRLLGVAAEDRWTFEKASKRAPTTTASTA